MTCSDFFPMPLCLSALDVRRACQNPLGAQTRTYPSLGTTTASPHSPCLSPSTLVYNFASSLTSPILSLGWYFFNTPSYVSISSQSFSQVQSSSAKPVKPVQSVPSKTTYSCSILYCTGCVCHKREKVLTLWYFQNCLLASRTAWKGIRLVYAWLVGLSVE